MGNATNMEQIHACLTRALNPRHLQVIDQSHLHRGHSGAREGGGHFEVCIAAEVFVNKSLITCHRMIYAALDELMGKEIHALSIKIKSDVLTAN